MFFDAVMLYFYFFNNSDGTTSIWTIVILVGASIIWYYLAHLFKTRSKRAVIAGLILIGFSFVSSLIGLNLIGVLITGYFLYLVYKVSKAPVAAV